MRKLLHPRFQRSRRTDRAALMLLATLLAVLAASLMHGVAKL